MSSVSFETRIPIDDKYRHWSPQSQTYASTDILIQYLAAGWKVENPAIVETYLCAGVRRSDIYHFNLKREDESLEMPVLASPMINRLIEKYGLTVLRVNTDRADEH
ncbi:MAG TPA: hypothetical protein VMT34_08930 [Aggregatilineales bacterium]|nr:hypothetical protein [Aggregatilineales bacterium]